MNSQRRTFRAPDEPRETEKELNGFTKSLIIELRELGGHRRSKPRRIRWMHKKLKRTHSQSVETERQNREPRTSTRGASRHRRQHSHSTGPWPGLRLPKVSRVTPSCNRDESTGCTKRDALTERRDRGKSTPRALIERRDRAESSARALAEHRDRDEICTPYASTIKRKYVDL